MTTTDISRIAVVDAGHNIVETYRSGKDAILAGWGVARRQGKVAFIRVKASELTRSQAADELSSAGWPTEDWRTVDLGELRRQVAEIWSAPISGPYGDETLDRDAASQM